MPSVADFDLHPRFGFGAGAPSEEFRMVGVGRKCETGRPPGALANSMRPESLQSRSDLADWLAGEATAALGWCEMSAEDFLNPGDAFAERLEIRFGGAGQDLHERAAADFARRLGRKRRQSSERPRFRHAMRALDARVQDQKNPPIPGELRPRDHRWDFGVRSSASVDRQATALEQCNAHARTRAAIEQARIFPRVEGKGRQSPERG